MKTMLEDQETKFICENGAIIMYVCMYVYVVDQNVSRLKLYLKKIKINNE